MLYLCGLFAKSLLKIIHKAIPTWHHISRKIMQMLHKNIFTIFLWMVNSTTYENFYHHLVSYIPNSYVFHSKRKIKRQNCLRVFLFSFALFLLYHPSSTRLYKYRYDLACLQTDTLSNAFYAYHVLLTLCIPSVFLCFAKHSIWPMS